MSEVRIMLPTDLPKPRASKYPSSPDRSSMGLGSLDKVNLLGDPSGDETPLESDKQMCFASEEDQEEGWNDLGGDGTGSLNSTNRKRHRRGKAKKRKWKPYFKLNWEERRQLMDREASRASRVRETRFANGQPVAPYNTTQFLMDDHNVQELDLSQLPNGHRMRGTNETAISSDGFYSSPEDEEEFLKQQFSEAYENVHAERLNAMSKAELVKEYLELEERVEGLEIKLKDKLRHSRKTVTEATDTVMDPGDHLHSPPPADQTKTFIVECRRNSDQQLPPHSSNHVESAEDRITRLMAENEKLKLENELLRTMIFPSAPP